MLLNFGHEEKHISIVKYFFEFNDISDSDIPQGVRMLARQLLSGWSEDQHVPCLHRLFSLRMEVARCSALSRGELFTETGVGSAIHQELAELQSQDHQHYDDS